MITASRPGVISWSTRRYLSLMRADLHHANLGPDCPLPLGARSVNYLLASEDTIQREFGAYSAVPDNFPEYVMSLDEFDMSRDGIKHRNIRNFLREEWV